MITALELESMREASRSALPAVCRITRPSGPPVFDPDTGSYTDPEPDVVYEGPCRVRTINTQDMDTQVGGLHESLSRYVGTVPWGCGDVQVDDMLTVTDGTDLNIVGRTFAVTDVRYSEWGIDRRLVLEDRQQPGGQA